MKGAVFAAVTTLFSLAAAAPSVLERHVRHERRTADESASRWVKREAVASDFRLPMRVGLTQNNLDLGHDLLMEVADPDSPRYGKHYTAEEIHDLFAPSTETVDAVRAWIEAAGIHPERISHSTNKQWLQFDAETHEAEALLKTTFHLYEHSDSGASSVGCDEYHVREDVRDHIDYITPGVKGLNLKPRGRDLAKRGTINGPHRGPIVKAPLPVPISEISEMQKTKETKYCDDYITPACLMKLYNVSEATTAYAGNELGIFEDLAQFLDELDMNLFYTYVYPRIPNGTFPITEGIDGAKNFPHKPKKAGAEAVLDFQISYPLIYPQQSVLFTTDDDYYQENYDFDGFFNTFLDAIDGSYCTYSAYGITGDSKIDPQYPDPHAGGYKGELQCGVYKPTNVISLSYSGAEVGSGESKAYQKRQCSEYMKLGMQGVTMVFASGDYGVSFADYCIDPDHGVTTNGTVFEPNFPATCPYVLGVGATTIVKGSKVADDDERATTQFGSGGGFSNHFARPSYQDSAVEAYFASPDAPTYPYYTGDKYGDGIYNRSGRGFPDVSSIGQDVVVFYDGEPYLIGGTSCAAPTWGALLTRINDERLTANKSTIGFINPTLYKNPSALNDVTVGTNPGCGTDGFSAATGWDPLTGLGTPKYESLLALFMSLD